MNSHISELLEHVSTEIVKSSIVNEAKETIVNVASQEETGDTINESSTGCMC